MMMPIDRRTFLRGLAASAAAAALSGLPSALRAQTPPATASASRPNIVLIMADDMGISDLGCYGSEIDTPNLDKLAAGGMRFTQFYNTARCCPTRAALLTGLYSHQAGVGNMVEDRGLPGYQGFLNDRCATVAEMLHDAGYRTLMTGKWHVGGQRPHWPVDRGFDHYYGLIDGGSNYFRIDPQRTFAHDDQRIRPDAQDFYMTDAFTDAAVDYLNEQKGKSEPFFLYVAYTAPHWPLHARQEDIRKYEGKYLLGWDKLRDQRRQKMIKLGLIDESWPMSPRDPKVPAWADVKDQEAQAHKMAVYAAQIDRMDQGIGRILAKLKETGADQNTLVLFLADNGGCAEAISRPNMTGPVGTAESFTSYGINWSNASNTPFRRHKSWTHEGGISSPLIAWWPGVIQPGTISQQVGHVIDLAPTCLAVAGAKAPAARNGKDLIPLEGQSLLPAFKGGKIDRAGALYWEHIGNRAVRRGKWKLVAAYQEPWELYDLEADRTETRNLADQHPDQVKELSDLYQAWADRCGVLPWQQVRSRRAVTAPSGE